MREGGVSVFGHSVGVMKLFRKVGDVFGCEDIQVEKTVEGMHGGIYMAGCYVATVDEKLKPTSATELSLMVESEVPLEKRHWIILPASSAGLPYCPQNAASLS